MDVTRAVFVYVVLCSVVRADLLKPNGDVARTEGSISRDVPKGSRVSHRVQLLFPLLLRISTRLATLIPTAIAGLIGIFLFVAFSKKAFIVSLFALFLTYLDKYKRDDNIIHIHKLNLYDDEFTHREEHVYHGWPQRKRFTYGKYPLPYAYNKFPQYPIRMPFLEGVRRSFARGANRTAPHYFHRFSSRNYDVGYI